jgi:hypothetical protein
LATNEWLRVRETDGVYAIGDCSSISQRKIMVNVKKHFINIICTLFVGSNFIGRTTVGTAAHTASQGYRCTVTVS